MCIRDSTCSTGSIRATISSASATSPSPGVPKEVPRATASWTAATTSGWEWPRIIGPHEHTRSTYSRPSASVRYGPVPDTMNRGVPPTARKARTGEFTPPGVTTDARSNSDCETGASYEYATLVLICDSGIGRPGREIPTNLGHR